MNKTHFIQLKAAFLLVIFSLNMVVGFACAAGAGMSFNAGHHHNKSTAKVHVHADGKKHRHEDAKHKHSHKDGKDDCCNDRVVKIAKTDKAIPQNNKTPNPVFFTAFTAVFYSINIFPLSQAYISAKYFVRGNHPPIPDIRIAIQSFQI